MSEYVYDFARIQAAIEAVQSQEQAYMTAHQNLVAAAKRVADLWGGQTSVQQNLAVNETAKKGTEIDKTINKFISVLSSNLDMAMSTERSNAQRFA
jgi:uncharacterized protein YukE